MSEDLFSRRYGYVPVKSIIQIESVDSDLRVDLWNIIQPIFFASYQRSHVADTGASYKLFVALQSVFFRAPIDEMPLWVHDVAQRVKELILTSPWYRVFDLLDFLAANAVFPSARDGFMAACNQVLERELSGYRFVNRRISPVSTDVEIEAIERALRDSQPIAPVHIHLTTALNFLADRGSPDYRNSIKESISAVEALCVLIAGDPKATLGSALSVVEKRVGLHGALKGAFSQLYGYTSDASGIRHALLDVPNLELADAQFMLVSCSGFVTYLLAKALKAGLSL